MSANDCWKSRSWDSQDWWRNGEQKRALTAKQLKDAIAANLGDTILIADNAHKWTASLKGWLEELWEEGHTLLLLGNRRDLEGVLFKIPYLPLPPLNEQQTRSIIWTEAAKLGVTITPLKAAELASKAGGNPLLAQRLVLDCNRVLIRHMMEVTTETSHHSY